METCLSCTSLTLLLLLDHIPVLPQTQQVSLQHGDRDLTDRRNIDRRLLPDVGFEVFLASDVDADASVLEPCSWDLVVLARDGADHHIRDSKARLQIQVSCGDDVVRVVTRGLGGRLVRSFRELDNRVNVSTKDTGAIIGEKGSKRSTDDFGSVDDGDDLASGSVTVRKQPVVHTNKFEHLDDGKGRAGQDGLDGTWGLEVFVSGGPRGGLREMRCGDGFQGRGGDVSVAG